MPEGVVIVAHFYDVESGRKDLDQRRGRAHERFTIAIPRDGGIQDLLVEAQRPDRRFDVVICESVDRISRRTYLGTQIEHTLEKAGVPLLASDEPITLTGRGATQTRHGPDLARVSDEQARALFDAFCLEITYDKPSHTARCRATLTADTLPRAVAAAGGDHAAIWSVPPTGFELEGCSRQLGSVTVEGSMRP